MSWCSFKPFPKQFVHVNHFYYTQSGPYFAEPEPEALTCRPVDLVISRAENIHMYFMSLVSGSSCDVSFYKSTIV